MENPKFRELWEEGAPNRAVMRALYTAREEQGITQAQLAERCGLKQSNLSRIESGGGNPSVATLQKIAHGLGKVLKIEFVDPDEIDGAELAHLG